MLNICAATRIWFQFSVNISIFDISFWFRNSCIEEIFTLMKVSICSWQWRLCCYDRGRGNVCPGTRPGRRVDTGPQTWQFRGVRSHLVHPVSFLRSRRGLMTDRNTVVFKASWSVQCSEGTLLLFFVYDRHNSCFSWWRPPATFCPESTPLFIERPWRKSNL